jgi:hypothetical protein
MGVWVLVVGSPLHSPGGREHLLVCVTVCARLSISMRSDGLVDEVWVNEVGFGITICRDTTEG